MFKRCAYWVSVTSECVCHLTSSRNCPVHQNAHEERKIQFLNLYFPHGASVAECDEIARRAQKIVGARVSEGGMTPTNKYGLNVDDVTFSEESMSYTFGYKKD